MRQSLSFAASAVALLAVGSVAPAQPQRPAKLDGYLLLRGQSAMLFPSRHARASFEFDKCRNLGASAPMFRRLRAVGSRRVTLWVMDLGDPYAPFRGTGYLKERLDGRAIEQWCDGRAIYWVQRLGS
jgi:hypothetical protein